MKVHNPIGTRPRVWVPLLFLSAAALLIWSVREWGGSGPTDPDLLWKLAQSDLQSGRYDRARAAVWRLARLRAPTPEDRMLKAQTDVATKRDDDAIAELARIADGHRLAPQARLLAGQVE